MNAHRSEHGRSRLLLWSGLPSRALRAANNIGLVRLTLACLVIIGHAPEIVDGNRSREPLTLVFGTMSLGEVAVDAFFLLSGFLITASFVESSRHFLWKRAARIYPAFLAAYAFSVLIEAQFLGLDLRSFKLETIWRALFLQVPAHYIERLPNIEHTIQLNGPMWTIAYEARCYMVTAILGGLGLLARRRLVLVLAIGSALLFLVNNIAALRWHVAALPKLPAEFLIIGERSSWIRLIAAYLVGTVVRLYWPILEPRLTGAWAITSLAVLVPLLAFRQSAEPALIILGAVPLFWLALRADLGSLQRVNDRWDISYGTYLYGWPAALMLLAVQPSLGPFPLAIASLVLALGWGAASWWGLERHLKLKRRPRPKPDFVAAPSR